jgi:hypothetical protein
MIEVRRHYCGYCDAETVPASSGVCSQCGNRTARPPAIRGIDAGGEGE